MNKTVLAICLFWFAAALPAAELSGVHVDDTIATENGQSLVLNGIGLREKLWVDVYVGSLYLPARTSDVAEILSSPGPWRVQLDFVYKEVSREKLLEAWREGFENNQSQESFAKLADRIDRFYSFFIVSAMAKDRYRFDYTPVQGVRVYRNGDLLGSIEGEDFKAALLEIWLGNKPADKQLKKGMLGL